MSHPSRRLFLGSVATTIAAAPGVYSADNLFRTPALTEGPFYPDKLPLNTDNDLIVIKDGMPACDGTVTHLTGRVLGPDGSPVRDALIEIWQCDSHAVYLHTSDSRRKADQQDKNFQGYGRFETASDGGYRFRTIKPVPYPGRPAPHIHFKISRGGRELLTSQIFIAGHPGNDRDGVFGGLRDLVDRELVQTEFTPIKDSKSDEVAARFDIVLNRTPDERSIRSRR